MLLEPFFLVMTLSVLESLRCNVAVRGLRVLRALTDPTGCSVRDQPGGSFFNPTPPFLKLEDGIRDVCREALLSVEK